MASAIIAADKSHRPEPVQFVIPNGAGLHEMKSLRSRTADLSEAERTLHLFRQQRTSLGVLPLKLALVV